MLRAASVHYLFTQTDRWLQWACSSGEEEDVSHTPVTHYARSGRSQALLISPLKWPDSAAASPPFPPFLLSHLIQLRLNLCHWPLSGYSTHYVDKCGQLEVSGGWDQGSSPCHSNLLPIYHGHYNFQLFAFVTIVKIKLINYGLMINTDSSC